MNTNPLDPQIALVKIIATLESIEENTSHLSGRLTAAEVKINDIDKMQNLSVKDIEYIKEHMNKPKASWMQIAAGVASLLAIFTVIAAILSGTFGG